MNAAARLLGIGIIGLAGFGFVHLATDPPDLPIRPIQPSAPALGADGEADSHVAFDPGIRMTFDSGKTVELTPQYFAEVWFCDGESGLIVGPAHIEDVCAVTFHRM